MNKKLINKDVLNNIIANSNICQHAIKELKLAGYGKGEGGPNDWIYQQVLEAVAVFSSHDNFSEIELVKKLCNFDVISPLRFTDDEWEQISIDGGYQNKRARNVFKEPNGKIYYIEAFTKRCIGRYNFATEEWTENEKSIYRNGGLFEHKNNILTGKYFNTCYLQQHDIINGWTPKPTRKIDCVKVEMAPDNWIMAVDTNDIDLIHLSLDYDIQWKNCFCMKDIRLEDVTPELKKKAFEEIKNNK